MADKVNTRSAAISKLAANWPMLEALEAGTGAMRSMKALMPQWPGEQDKSYEARLATATLFPAYRRTVSVMVGKPFSKAPTHSEDTPEQIKAWCDDIDLEGVNLATFAAEMFAETFFGLAGILVEAPKPVTPTGAVVTKQDEINAGVRPYFVRVRHNQIIGWREEVRGGRRMLTQLRIAESKTVPDGDFGEKAVERVRVLTPGAWQVWECIDAKSDAWAVVDQGLTTLDVIPFVPLYGLRKGFMCGAPPLLDLAFQNVKHWQSQSDQDTILHVARVPILYLTGGDDNTVLTIGAGAAVKGPVGSDLKFVEHTGKAIDAGQSALTALEDQMIQSGAELLVKKPGARTATESANDAEGNKSDLQRMVEGFENSLDQALALMARYGKLATGGHVSLFKDFGAADLSAASGQLVISMQQSGLIQRKTAIEEMKRRGELSADIVADDEIEAVDAEGPALGTIGDGTDPNAPDPAGARAA